MGIDPMGELRELGYELRGHRLYQVGSDRGFEYENGQQYERLADELVKYIELLLEEEGDLRPLWLPLGVERGEGCPIYVSDGFEHAERLLLLVPGAGRAGAGVWGCALCINQSLDEGSALPYVQNAKRLGYGLVLLNPNCNSFEGAAVKGSETSEKHLQYVMEQVIGAHCSAPRLDVVAHSIGGRSLMTFLCRPSSKRFRFEHIAFTDSYHSKSQVSFLGPDARDQLADSTKVLNFVPHAAPIGTPVDEWLSQEYRMTQDEKGCSCVSAGVQEHAATNYAAMGAVFAFFEQEQAVFSESPATSLSVTEQTTTGETSTTPLRPRPAPAGAAAGDATGTPPKRDVPKAFEAGYPADASRCASLSVDSADSQSRLSGRAMAAVRSCRGYLQGSLPGRRSSDLAVGEERVKAPQVLKDARSADFHGSAPGVEECEKDSPQRVRSAMMPAPRHRSCTL